MRQFLMVLFALPVFAGAPIDLTQIDYENDVYVLAIDVKANPSNMPTSVLWDDPIMLVYKKVDSFENIRADVVRSQIKSDIDAGTYQPVVLHAQQGTSLTIHFKNLIGIDSAPVRTDQGAVCKSCPAKRAYTFSYGENAEHSQFPFLASIHGHGIKYDIVNDGTRAGTNLQNGPQYDGLVSPGSERTYTYDELDFVGVWPLHDHANPSHTVNRGLHMALVVDPVRDDIPVDHDFLIIFSDYPDYDQYIDTYYQGLFIPPFLHMQNSNVMHAHALNGYAAMLPPRMKMATNVGGATWDAMRTDLIEEPKTPVFEVDLGDLVRFRFMSMGSSITHSFHLHGHVWWDTTTRKYSDNMAVPSGSTRDIVFYAGGYPFHQRGHYFNGPTSKVRSGAGDWLYHCHIIPHVKHGMWGIFRVRDPKDGDSDSETPPGSRR